MAYSNEFGLFQALEQVLKGAEKPMLHLNKLRIFKPSDSRKIIRK